MLIKTVIASANSNTKSSDSRIMSPASLVQCRSGLVESATEERYVTEMDPLKHFAS